MGTNCRTMMLALFMAGALLQGCATGGGARREVDPATALKEAQEACKALFETQLKAPIKTVIGPRVKAIQAARKAQKLEEAVDKAKDLESMCSEETRLREELGQVAHEVHLIRTEVPRKLYNRFMKLALSGRYTEAIYCGDGLLTKRLQRCDVPDEHHAPTLSGTVTILDAERDGSASETVIKYKEQQAKEAAARRRSQPSRDVKRAMASAHQRELYKGDAAARAELPPDLPTSKDEKKPREEKGRLWTWVALGGAGALLITGGVLGGLAQSQYNDLEKTCPNCLQEDIDRGSSLAIGADVMFGLGTVAAAAGAVLFFFEKKWFADDEPGQGGKVKVGVAPGGFLLTGNF